MHLRKEKIIINELLERRIKSTLKYQRENILYEPMKIIPLLNKKGLTKITHYGIIEIPIVHSTFIRM